MTDKVTYMVYMVVTELDSNSVLLKLQLTAHPPTCVMVLVLLSLLFSCDI